MIVDTQQHHDYLLKRIRQLRHDAQAIQRAIDSGEASPNELGMADHLRWARRGAFAFYQEIRSFKNPDWDSEAWALLKDTSTPREK